MKAGSRAKLGNRKNNPAYRTPSVFRYKQQLKNTVIKSTHRRASNKD
jgi:hypothetical protein